MLAERQDVRTPADSAPAGDAGDEWRRKVGRLPDDGVQFMAPKSRSSSELDF